MLEDNAWALQLILDPLHSTIPEVLIGAPDFIELIEELSRDLIYNLHGERWRLLGNL
jgi:hypothetical protein